MKTLLSAVEKKTLIPVLQAIRVKDGLAIATDMDIFVTYRTEDIADGLYHKIGFDKKETRAAMPIDATDFPDLPADQEFTMSRLINYEQLEFVARAQSKEETRYYLCGIQFDNNAMVATDGHRLNMIKMQSHEDEASFIVPSKAIKLAMFALKESKQTVAAFFFSKRYCYITVGNIAIMAKLIDGTYPDYRRVIPDTKGKKKTALDTSEIANIKKTVKILAKQNGVKFPNATLSQNLVLAFGGKFELKATKLNAKIGFNLDLLSEATSGTMYYERDNTCPILIEGNNGFMSVVMPTKI